ncbi:two-component system sensor histidine kinase NtrB [Bacillus pinisoli]|uniref:two-component system sensor histidine kinase NtrB n=1 Tax=Bacillus pinisoli TaxID=2901866 RepID=UPI001FF2E478|nr:ATP-binding protein [Bacillus pinisoli]
MKNTAKCQEDRIKQLEQELQAYREMLKHIPSSLSYKDFEKGIHIEKQPGSSMPTLTHIHKKFLPKEFEQDVLIEQEIPFEKIEKLIQPIFDTVPHHLVFIDKHGMITSCNRKAAEDLGVDRDSTIGKHIRDLLNLPDELIMLLETLKTEEPIINREVLDSNYGINNTRIYRNQHGEIIRVLGSFQYLNMVKESEKQALAGRIAAGIAHEVRNPLTTVRGYLQFLNNDFEPETSDLIRSLLIPELDRANKIITDFLTIAKPSDSKPELVNINQFIINGLGPFLKSEAILHNAEVIFECSDEVDPYWVSIRTSEILQVFINLLRNALDAKGGQPLQIRLQTKLDQQRINIIFCDNGTGIPPTILEHIFDPFFTTKDEGTGLGLSISRKMVENQGGTISVRSSENGTSFYIQLPFSKKLSS